MPSLCGWGRWRSVIFVMIPRPQFFKLRQFAELLCQRIAASHALYQGDRGTFENTLRRLYFERIIQKKLQKYSTGFGLKAMPPRMRQRVIIRMRSYGKQPGFKAGPFVPPPEPVDATTPLHEEIERLRRAVAGR